MTEDLLERECDVKGGLLLNSFSGGQNGRCVQLTIPGNDGYVQMTFDQARKIFKDFIEAINEIEEQYNLSPPWWEEMAKK